MNKKIEKSLQLIGGLLFYSLLVGFVPGLLFLFVEISDALNGWIFKWTDWFWDFSWTVKIISYLIVGFFILIFLVYRENKRKK